MSVKSDTFYWLVCDFPDCAAEIEGYDFGRLLHADPADAADEARDHDWQEGRDGKSWFCGSHPGEWASDHENGEPFTTAPPYLLIHDGDTGDHRDNGLVSLVTEATP